MSRPKIYIPKSTEDARSIGKRFNYRQALSYWNEYKRSLSDQTLIRAILRKSFREQMLRETVEGYLGVMGHHSLTKDEIEGMLDRIFKRIYGKKVK